MATAAAANLPLSPQSVDPGLPPLLPDGVPFDLSSVCYVVMAAEAERLHSENRASRYEDAASGFFAAQVHQSHPRNEQEAIAKAKQTIAGHPERYRLNCTDAIAVGYAALGEPQPRAAVA